MASRLLTFLAMAVRVTTYLGMEVAKDMKRNLSADTAWVMVDRRLTFLDTEARATVKVLTCLVTVDPAMEFNRSICLATALLKVRVAVTDLTCQTTAVKDMEDKALSYKATVERQDRREDTT